MLATLTSKGQLTLPVSIREKLHLKPGDKIELFTKADGHIEGIPVKKTVASLKGILPKPAKAISLEEMDRAIIEGASNDRD
jgi:AbrB family looped-hinge helix DNA binding protein